MKSVSSAASSCSCVVFSRNSGPGPLCLPHPSLPLAAPLASGTLLWLPLVAVRGNAPPLPRALVLQSLQAAGTEALPPPPGCPLLPRPPSALLPSGMPMHGFSVMLPFAWSLSFSKVEKIKPGIMEPPLRKRTRKRPQGAGGVTPVSSPLGEIMQLAASVRFQ